MMKISLGNLFNSPKKKMYGGKAHIYNLIIVNESGSMSSLKKVTLSGINKTIRTIRRAQEEYSLTQKHTLTLVTFFDSYSKNPNIKTRIDNKPITEVEEFKDYSPAVGHLYTMLWENR